jgi:hypothetical protein
VCTDLLAPANHCRIISTLGEPLETLLIGPQTFQGCGLVDRWLYPGWDSGWLYPGWDSLQAHPELLLPRPRPGEEAGASAVGPMRWSETGQDLRGVLSFLWKLIPTPSHELNIGRR